MSGRDSTRICEQVSDFSLTRALKGHVAITETPIDTVPVERPVFAARGAGRKRGLKTLVGFVVLVTSVWLVGLVLGIASFGRLPGLLLPEKNGGTTQSGQASAGGSTQRATEQIRRTVASTPTAVGASTRLRTGERAPARHGTSRGRGGGSDSGSGSGSSTGDHAAAGSPTMTSSPGSATVAPASPSAPATPGIPASPNGTGRTQTPGGRRSPTATPGGRSSSTPAATGSTPSSGTPATTTDTAPGNSGTAPGHNR
jgi:hypothetical protein